MTEESVVDEPIPLRKLKDAIRERDGYRCTKCGMTADEHDRCYGRELDVHRVTPGSEYSLQDGVCITICRDCHGSQPKRQPGTAKKPNRILSVGVQFYTDGTTVSALNSYLDSLEPEKTPTRRAVWEVAMQNYLRERGYWPPPDPDPKPKK